MPIILGFLTSTFNILDRVKQRNTPAGILIIILAGLAMHMNYNDDLVKFILSTRIESLPMLENLYKYSLHLTYTVGLLSCILVFYGTKKVFSYESEKSLIKYTDFVAKAKTIAMDLQEINKIVEENPTYFESSRVWKKIYRKL